MDVFIEYMVKKQNTGKDILLKIFYAGASVVILVGSFLFIPLLGQMFSMFAPLIGFGAVFGAWYLITSMNVEYEYILTNGEMDVDKIVAPPKVNFPKATGMVFLRIISETPLLIRLCD